MGSDANEKIHEWIRHLGDSDKDVRRQAREQLVAKGCDQSVRALIMVLNSSSRDARWEASKALIAIRDPIAAPVLAHQLCDEDNDLRWVAAEGLATLGEPGLRAVLTAAIRHARDPEFCQAVRHAIEEFHRHGIHSEMLKPVIDACKSAEPGVAIPVAAYQALESL